MSLYSSEMNGHTSRQDNLKESINLGRIKISCLEEPSSLIS